MPKGIYKHKPNQGFQKGHGHFDGSGFQKKHIPWNKGLKGYTNKGSFTKGHTRTQGENNPAWLGGVNIDDRGYIRVNTKPNHWEYEHRLVMKEYLGRELTYDENIHHINGDKQDNSLENLQLLTRSEHITLHNRLKRDSL